MSVKRIKSRVIIRNDIELLQILLKKIIPISLNIKVSDRY